MKMLFLLGCVMLIASASADTPSAYSDQCRDKLQEFIGIFSNNQTYEYVKFMVRTSGKDYNDFGRFSDCKEKPDQFRYMLFTCKEDRCGDRFPTSMSLGLCVPKECSIDDFMFLLDTVDPVLNSLILPVEFKDILDKYQHSLRNTDYGETELQLSTSDFELVDSTAKNLEVTSFGFGNFIVSVMVAALLVVVIGSSIIQWRRDKAAYLKRLEAIREIQNPKESEGRDKAKEIQGSENAPEEENQPSFMNRVIIKSFAFQHSMKKLVRRPECIDYPGNRYMSDDKELDVFNCVKVFSIFFVILGNTFLFLFKGPVRNIEAIQSWPHSYFFSFVLQADLQSDVFYWITAFIWSYRILKFQEAASMLDKKDGIPSWKLVLGRYLRFAPQYLLMILVLWKVIPLFGGYGPRFYQFEEEHGCSETWFLHLIYLNNFFPWKQTSNCLKQTWYLANDLQFFALLPVVTKFYMSEKKKYYIICLGLFAFCLLIQLIVVLKNHMTASYLTEEDSYWTLFYYKPYTRVQGYLIGAMLGCEYFSFKVEERKKQKETEDGSSSNSDDQLSFSSSSDNSPYNPNASIMEAMRDQKMMAIASVICGVLIQFIIVQFHKWINNNPNTLSEGWSILYLLFSRPVYIIGFSVMIMPIVVNNKQLRPIRRIMGHEFWFPQARLVYGIFLCNTIFMQFLVYDLEQGIWLQELDIVLFFFAFTTFSIIFSCLTYIVIEGPVSNLIRKTYFKFEKFNAKLPEDFLKNTPVQPQPSINFATSLNDTVEATELDQPDNDEPLLQHHAKKKRRKRMKKPKSELIEDEGVEPVDE